LKRSQEADGHHLAIDHHLPAMRHGEGRNDANRCLPIFLRLLGLRRTAPSQIRRLLRVLFVWIGSMSACSGGQRHGRLLLCPIDVLKAIDPSPSANEKEARKMMEHGMMGGTMMWGMGLVGLLLIVLLGLGIVALVKYLFS
jgi:hypothetical protein